MTKTLTQPLLVLLFFQILGLIFCWTRLRSRKGNALPLAAVSLAVMLLAVFSMPIVGDLLLDSLSLHLPPGNMTPEYVVVLSGGMEESTSPDLDVLSLETTKRVLSGVRYWKQHPSARIVMSGTSGGRNPGRITELMAEVARSRGVPAASILREPNATDTSEHPIRLRALPGFAPTTRLAIVTSGYHERRAMTEFRRYFRFVVPAPVPYVHHRHLVDWVPANRGLLNSTAAIQEWIGIVWYQIRPRR